MKWTQKKVAKLFNLPFLSLIYKAQQIHRKNFNANTVELCTILNIKTGACPEDCGYCSQSGHYQTNLKKEKLVDLDKVIAEAKLAKENGAKRFCMGAAWRSPPDKDIPRVIEMIKAVKAVGLETCVTLGMLNQQQVTQLEEAGLDFYNHNLDTSPQYYPKIVSTRTYQSRLDTLKLVHESSINVCCGGILGIGETHEDRMELLIQLANLPAPPKSVPINQLIPIKGTPLANVPPVDNIEFIRTLAVARIMMPSSILRLSAGREKMSEEMQALCFMAGANSMWLGEKLLTVDNKKEAQDQQFLEKLGIDHQQAVCK